MLPLFASMQPLLPDGILVPQCRYELRMITFLAWIFRSPYTALPSITVPAVVMVRGPVYFVNALPAGRRVSERWAWRQPPQRLSPGRQACDQGTDHRNRANQQ